MRHNEAERLAAIRDALDKVISADNFADPPSRSKEKQAAKPISRKAKTRDAALSNPMEFSKKILIVVAVVNIAVIMFALWMVFETKNLDPLNVLIPAVMAEMGVGTGFYYHKAKIENKLKILAGLGIQPERRC